MNPTAAAQLGIKPFEAADYLQSDEDCAQHLQACMDEAPDDAALFTKAVGDIARARGMMQLARDTGITREGLYKALGERGYPSFSTVVKVLHALGLQLNVGTWPAQATNNAVERVLRDYVIKRKLSYCTRSKRGMNLIERIFSTAQICKMQGRVAYDFITDSVQSWSAPLRLSSLAPEHIHFHHTYA